MPATKAEREARKQQLRDLASRFASMSEEQRTAMSERLGTVVNPDGRPLSIRNTFLLMQFSGREDLTMVGGFRQWINHGRMVRKGEHACGFILVPMSNGKKADAADDDDEGKRKGGLHFKHVPVFDVSQTDDASAQTEAA